MQGLLSFDQAPPLDVPMRFFLTAPLFAMAAALLLLASGPALLLSRWTPAALAFTHLFTVGFMLQVMLGALQQLFPVALGANFRAPQCIAFWVHGPLTLGAALLALAFLTPSTWLFHVAMLPLGLSVGVFLAAASIALRGVNWRTNPTARSFWVALAGLAITVVLGLTLAYAFGTGNAGLPLVLLTQLHLSWGFLVWCGALVAAVALMVVPMFLVTPQYPRLVARLYALGLLAGTLAWTLAALVQWEHADSVLGSATVLLVAVFCGQTLKLVFSSRRGKRETLHHFWTLGLTSALLGCAVWMAQAWSPVVAQWPATPLLLGVLMLVGTCGSIMTGMLYKIVPFLIWQHLQNQGRGQVLAPNMKKVIPQTQLDRQWKAHVLACGGLLIACIWPTWLAHAAALALLAAQVLLFQNLRHAKKVYENHQAVIAATLSALAAAN